MKNIIIVGCGTSSTLSAIREKFPDVEVITPEEAKERGIDLDKGKAISIDQKVFELKVPELKTPYFEDIRYSGKRDAQTWKRRGKNTKV